MLKPSPSPSLHRSTGWFPSLRALWAIVWRLSILLLFFVGACFCVIVAQYWAALGCVIVFAAAAFFIRRVSTVEDETSSGDSVVFL